MMASGHLRRDAGAPPPWQYRGEIILPGGRYAIIEASVAEDAGGKFFELRAGLAPGMDAAELEGALIAVETEHAARVQREGTSIADMPSDELPF